MRFGSLCFIRRGESLQSSWNVSISPFESASAIITTAAGAAYVNSRTLRLPQTIALTLSGALVSLLIAAADHLWPVIGLGRAARLFMSTIDFRTALLNVMLSFLLFAALCTWI